ncbi:hypothetical protein, partial [Aquimarina algiphila]|uniref:hypothetical protein n=1 Tax=Aquimarina algiphila TaxID=2047982 RepID=UPI002330DC35
RFFLACSECFINKSILCQLILGQDILITYLVWSFVFFFKSKRKRNHLLQKLLLVLCITIFNYIWFIPIEIGWRGELPVCKFRFQVFEYDTHDYSGHGDFKDLFFRSTPKKYGMIDIHEKIGGWKEYFGLKSFEYDTNEEYFGK